MRMLQGGAHCAQHSPRDALRGSPDNLIYLKINLIIFCDPSCSVPVPQIQLGGKPHLPPLGGTS